MSGRKNKFWLKFFWTFGVIIVSCVIAIWITGYTYIYKTLIYAYPNIDDLNIFDTRIINDSVPEPWPVSSQYNKKKLPDYLNSENQNNESVAYLVIKNDSLVYEQYWDNYNEKSHSNSFSVAKSIVGVLTGIAIDEGLIKIDDPVGKYIPEFSEGENVKLRVKHLLMMASGLNWDESYSSLFSPTTEAYYGTNLQKVVTRLKVVEEPGKIFRYQSCNTVLLAMIISKASGRLISDYASEKLWNKIGATQPAFWSLDHHEGLEKTYCCFYSNARDFAKLGKLYLNGGTWNGKQVVSSAYVRESISPNGCIDEFMNVVDYYGYQWWLTNIEGQEIFYARGILGQYIIVIPDERMIVVRLGNKRGVKNEHNQYTDMVNYTKGALEAFGNAK